MIYLPSFQWIITVQTATWRDQNLFVLLLPTTSDRSLLAITGDVTAESTGSYSETISYTNIMPFSNLGNCWDLDLLEQPAPQLGHRNAYSLGLRSVNQAQKLLKQGNRYLLKAISSLTWQNPSSDRLRGSGTLSFWCFGLLPEYSPHSLAEISVESDPAS